MKSKNLFTWSVLSCVCVFGLRLLAQGCSWAPDASHGGAAPNTTFTYEFGSGFNDTGDSGLADTACGENAIFGPNFDGTGWNGRNTGGSGVTFEPTTSNPNFLIVRVAAGGLGTINGHAIPAATNISFDPSTGYATGGYTRIDAQVTDCTALQKVVAHELGHPQGLGDADFADGGTVMNQMSDFNDTANFLAADPTTCDSTTTSYMSWGDPCDSGMYYPDCPEDWNWDDSGCCYDSSPEDITISPDGSVPIIGSNQVMFDNQGRGTPLSVGWITNSVRHGFLFLDRNHDGVVTDGTELFGRTMPQHGRRCTWNAVSAMKELDRRENGGNQDEILDSRDQLFNSIQVWFDKNEDGISTPDEIVSLKSLGVVEIDLRSVSGAMVVRERPRQTGRSTVRGTVWGRLASGNDLPLYIVRLEGRK